MSFLENLDSSLITKDILSDSSNEKNERLKHDQQIVEDEQNSKEEKKEFFPPTQRGDDMIIDLQAVDNQESLKDRKEKSMDSLFDSLGDSFLSFDLKSSKESTIQPQSPLQSNLEKNRPESSQHTEIPATNYFSSVESPFLVTAKKEEEKKKSKKAEKLEKLEQ